MQKEHIEKIGVGEFGDIYQGVKGQEAVNFLLSKRSGEILGAFSHPQISEPIDLVWGMGGEMGYGLVHIEEKHPEILSQLARMIMESTVVSKFPDRVILLHDDNRKVIISLTWEDCAKVWLVTAYAVFGL